MNHVMPKSPEPRTNRSVRARPAVTTAPTFDRDDGRASRGRKGIFTELEQRALRGLLSRIGDPTLNVVLYGDTETSHLDESSMSQVVVKDRMTLWKLVIDPLLQFGEAYSDGRIEVRGDLSEVLTELYRALARRRSNGELTAWPLRLLRRRRGNTRSRSRRNITHHYDIGTDFYRLWLDRSLVYTCAYFPDDDMTLEEAQVAKMDHVCRKLRLTPGQTVVEAGCGWGALALHMARNYGVHVRAFNISPEQLRHARRQARAQELDDRVEFVEEDWRGIDTPCDAFVSVGMLEHVGASNYGRLGAVIDTVLKPGGIGLIHSIGQNRPQLLNPWIERRIFPGAYGPTLREMTRICEPYDFSILDVENLGLHYATTLEHWLDRYERVVERVRRMFDERFVRMWRLYLAGSMAAFATGSLQLFQVVFSKGVDRGDPWRRQDLYRPASGAK